MNRKRISGFLLCLTFLGGCAATVDAGTEGNTSWLPCRTDDDCEDACVCGFCTRPCDTRKDCADLDVTAVCASVARAGGECEAVPHSEADLAVCAPLCTGPDCAVQTERADEATSDAGSATPQRDGSPGAADPTSLDEPACTTTTSFVAAPLPPHMLILLDQSSSMAESVPGASTSKWEATTAALRSFVADPSFQEVEIGLQYFGLSNECDAATYARPAVEVAPMSETSSAIIESLGAHGPSTLTPTYPALEGTLGYMAERAAQLPRPPHYVVLISDGFPTQCSETGGPLSGTSIPALAELTDRFASATHPVETYAVIVGEGLEGLAAISQGIGSTGSYGIANSEVEQGVSDALRGIARVRLRCEYVLETSSVTQESRITVKHASPEMGESETLQRVRGLDDCTGSRDEWFLDTATDLPRIELCPETCWRPPAPVTIDLGCLPDAR